MPELALGALLRGRGAVHFDLDGVLLDSNELKVRCMVDAIAGLGPQIVAPFVAEFRASFGRNRREHFRRLYCHHIGGGEAGWEDFFAIYGGTYGALVGARYPGAALCENAVALICELADAGVPMTVITGTPTHEAVAVLESHGLAGRFQAILGGEQPKPVRIREALAATGTAREDAAFLGDSLADMQAANQMRVPFVFVERYSLDPSVPEVATARGERVLVARDLDPAGVPLPAGVRRLRPAAVPAPVDVALARVAA